MDSKAILDFAFELGQLRRIKHEGWRTVGVEFPESVAEHSFRAAQIGYLLACMENYENPHEVSTLVLFHDIAEARTGDFHRVAKRYVSVNEQLAVDQQTNPLGSIGKDLQRYWIVF